MKRIILGLFLFSIISAGHSQILLKEAKVDSRLESMKRAPVSNRLLMKIPGNAAGEFEKDALAFMQKNFDVHKFIRDNEDGEYDDFRIFMKSKKGKLTADFDQSGNLVSTSQKFRNVSLPRNALMQISTVHQDAAIVGNRYYVSTKGWEVEKAYYTVKLKDGNKTRKIKIIKDRDQYSLAGL